MYLKQLSLLQISLIAIFLAACGNNPAGNEETYEITISPASGGLGTLVTISGDDVPDELNSISVAFNDIMSQTLGMTEAGDLQAVVPIGATTGPITIYNHQDTNQVELTAPDFEVTGIGTIEVEIDITGSTKDLDGFVVLVSMEQRYGNFFKSFKGNNNLSLGLPESSATITLLAVDSYCTSSGDEKIINNVEKGSSTSVKFEVTCNEIVLSDYIAYESSDIDNNKEIYLKSRNDNLVYNPDEKTNSVRLTNNPASDIEPAISPNGKRVAFSSDREGNYDLYLLDINSMELEQITFSEGFDNTDPVWSSDGTKLYFETDRNGNSDIYSITLSDGIEEAFLNSDANEIDITFAFEEPFYAYSSDESGTFKVLVFEEDSTPIQLEFYGDHVDPTFSKDGNLLAFIAKSDNSSSLQVYSTRLDWYVFGRSASSSNYLAPAFATDNALLYVRKREQPVQSSIVAFYPDDHEYDDWFNFRIHGVSYSNPDMGVYLSEN